MSTTKTNIGWCDRTWNPTRGCTRISPGCQHCFAEAIAYRFSGPGKPFEGLAQKTNGHPQWTGVVRTVEDALLEPLSWRKPQRIFVNSMSDLFHESVPDEFIDRVFAVMALAPRHTFQILTKRPGRMRKYLAADRDDRIRPAIQTILHGEHHPATKYPIKWPLSNVWLGVSCEDQQRADERIPLLLQTPAAVRFISAEPLLGPLDLRSWLSAQCAHPGEFCEDVGCAGEPAHVHWVIVGGESGSGARPCDLAWVRSIVQQCKAAGVACFVKQLGANVASSEVASSAFAPLISSARPLKDRRGGDVTEWPEDLRVREFPSAEETH